MIKKGYNRKTIKKAWSNEQLKELMVLSKDRTVSEIAKIINRDEKAVINMSSRMGYGYRTK